MTGRVDWIERSATRQIFDLAQQLDAADGDDLVSLEIGEPDFDTPTHIIEATNRSALKSVTHFTSNAGHREFRTAIAETTESAHELTVDLKDEVLVTTGMMETPMQAILVVVGPGTRR